MEKGLLKQNGVHLLDHEYETVKLLLENGYSITLIPPMQIKGMNTPDIMFDGIVWEMKSPTGGGKYTIKHTVQNAKHQSSNVIVDLRRCKLQDEHAIRELKHHFELSKRLRRMKIITKYENILDYTK